MNKKRADWDNESSCVGHEAFEHRDDLEKF